MKKAIFLDRDGTINLLPSDKPYLFDFQQVKLFPQVKEVLHKFKKAGYLLIVVTNQTGVGAGYYSQKDAEQVNEEIQRQLALKFDAIYSCYHHPQANCNCRKPKTGLFEQALKDFEIDVENSFMIGDKEKDIEAGKKLGLKTILFNSSNLEKTFADFVCKNWKEIEKIIIGIEK